MVEEHPTLILSIGCQGAGKSRLFKGLRKHEQFKDVVYLSADDMRTFKIVDGYAILDPAGEEEVKKKYEELFLSALKDRKSIILDRTHLTKKSRSSYIEKAKKANYEIVIYYFKTSLEFSLYHNQLRSQKCPEILIRKAFFQLEPPSKCEGNFIIRIVDDPLWLKKKNSMEN